MTEPVAELCLAARLNTPDVGIGSWRTRREDTPGRGDEGPLRLCRYPSVSSAVAACVDSVCRASANASTPSRKSGKLVPPAGHRHRPAIKCVLDCAFEVVLVCGQHRGSLQGTRHEGERVSKALRFASVLHAALLA